ncbi:MAG TPA: response regulator [Terracidiphilus sp.]|nr:response regulator [Terracidiphilus sp.]
MANDSKGQRVLIVDDEQMIADTLSQILNASGFNAKAVFSGELAVSAAQEFQPEILLTDVIMRGVSGIDVGVAISRMLPDCRVILFSGQASTADLLDRAQALGYRFEIIAKPIHPRELLKALNSPRS